MKNLEIFESLYDFIEKSWFYDNEEEDCRLLNADSLIDFIKWLENQ